MNEFELKFQVPLDRAAGVEAALRRGRVETRRLRARYFDTPDEALAGRQLTLRLRKEGRRLVQTAKGPGQGGFDRLEHDVPLSPGEVSLPDPDRHDGHPVHALLRRALDGAQGALQPAFDTDVERTSRTVRGSGMEVEIALDRGKVHGGGRAARVLELEFELKQGSAAGLVELARSWCEAHGLWLDPLTKSGLGRRLAQGQEEAPPTRWSGVAAQDGPVLAALFDAVLRQVLGNARELAAGTGGDEHVHQLRTGLRRLRTALRELQALGAWAPPPAELEQSLRQLFSVLGAHRDQATLLPRLARELAHAGNPMRDWQPELPDVGAAIREAAVQAALLRVVALAQELRRDGGPGRKAIRALARERLRQLHRKVMQEGRRFEQLADPERHRVRKRLKRLRYLAELVRPLFAAREVDRYVDALEELQDALGGYQDADAGGTLLARRAQDDPGAWFGVGWLAARKQPLAAECAAACRRAARRARPFWG